MAEILVLIICSATIIMFICYLNNKHNSKLRQLIALEIKMMFLHVYETDKNSSKVQIIKDVNTAIKNIQIYESLISDNNSKKALDKLQNLWIYTNIVDTGLPVDTFIINRAYKKVRLLVGSGNIMSALDNIKLESKTELKDEYNSHEFKLRKLIDEYKKNKPQGRLGEYIYKNYFNGIASEDEVYAIYNNCSTYDMLIARLITEVLA